MVCPNSSPRLWISSAVSAITSASNFGFPATMSCPSAVFAYQTVSISLWGASHVQSMSSPVCFKEFLQFQNLRRRSEGFFVPHDCRDDGFHIPADDRHVLLRHATLFGPYCSFLRLEFYGNGHGCCPVLCVNVQIRASERIALPSCRVVPCPAFGAFDFPSCLACLDHGVSQNGECVSHEGLKLGFRSSHGKMLLNPQVQTSSSGSGCGLYSFHRTLPHFSSRVEDSTALVYALATNNLPIATNIRRCSA